MAFLQTDSLCYTYEEKTPFAKEALKNVSFSIDKGEIVALIGQTGSGKSTLIQHLNGLLRPNAGRVYLEGADIWAAPKEIRRVRFRVGLVFQYPEYQLFEETAWKDIAFGPTNMGLEQGEVEQRVRQAASAVGLPRALLDKSPFDLSGGEKRRVAIAGVLAMRPEVLILDEPTAGLDPRGREIILRYVRAYRDQTGAAVLLVSHSMEDMARIADRVVVMHRGEIALSGSVADVYAREDILANIGLSVPAVTAVFTGLRARGVRVPTDVFTVQQALSALLSQLKGGGGRA